MCSQALVIRHLSKTYANGFQALQGIDLTVEEGDFFALLGPNGAGKSTTLGIVSSLINKTEGQIEVCGIDIDKDFATAKRQLGVVPQEFNFNQFEKVLDIVVTQGGFYGMPLAQARSRAEHYLNALGLWDKRHQASRMLSGGMKRRLMIARALVHQPKLLILDEPTAGVDIELRRSMWDFMREINAQGTTIILTTHYLEEAESLCRNIAIIDQGKIIKNSSMKSLLQELNTETFIFDTRTPLTAAVNQQTEGYQVRVLDDSSLEVDLRKGCYLNQVFNFFESQGIQVSSMRNKSNRLEELFVELVQAKTHI